MGKTSLKLQLALYIMLILSQSNRHVLLFFCCAQYERYFFFFNIIGGLVPFKKKPATFQLHASSTGKRLESFLHSSIYCQVNHPCRSSIKDACRCSHFLASNRGMHTDACRCRSHSGGECMQCAMQCATQGAYVQLFWPSW